MPPMEYVIYRQCKEWNVLPYPGGLLNQPVELMLDLSTCHKAEEVVNKKEKAVSNLFEELDKWDKG